MQILLMRSVETLGRAGDVVNVRPGYARNYLFPQGLAAEVGEGNLRRAQRELRREEEEAARRVEALRALAARLDGVTVTVPSRANAEGSLFGSVTEPAIAEALRAQGFEVDARAVRLDRHLKELGVFRVPIHLARDLEAAVRVWVVDPVEE